MQEKYSVQEIFNLIRTKKSDFWERTREQQALKLFHQAARRVPAYKDFLKKQGINPTKIKTWKDFQRVPIVDKKNYLRQYSLEKLCWDGSIQKPLVFTATSGSTGEPFYFPRGSQLDWECSIIHEMFFKNGLRDINGPTLVIVSFGMGIWIAGIITYKAFELTAQRNNYPISIITPGINKTEIFNALKKLAPNFKQTILAGYPPFIKDVIDEAEEQGINLKKLNIHLLFAAEAISEKFRDYLIKKTGIKNLYLDTLNIYGSADIGALAWENTISILIKRLSLKNKKLFQEIFSSINKTPTLAQYNPLFTTFEAPGGEILLTGNNTVPLIRYAIGDHGGVLGFNDAVSLLKKHNFNLKEEAQKEGVENHLYQLPFVYVYERADLSTTLYGLQIFPEVIREALMHRSLNNFLTGKFAMLTKLDKNHDQYLEINLELRKNKRATPNLKKLALNIIFSFMRSKSSEFRELSNHLQEKVMPKLVFWPAEHPVYFKPGAKQKWVKR